MGMDFGSAGFEIGSLTIPWGIVALIVAVLIGLFLIRAAMTLIKILIIVAIGVVAYVGFQALMDWITS